MNIYTLRYFTEHKPNSPPPPKKNLNKLQHCDKKYGSLSYFPDSIIFWLCLQQFFHPLPPQTFFTVHACINSMHLLDHNKLNTSLSSNFILDISFFFLNFLSAYISNTTFMLNHPINIYSGFHHLAFSPCGFNLVFFQKQFIYILQCLKKTTTT